MTATVLTVVGSPEGERPPTSKGDTFTGHVAYRNFQWDVTVHASSSQQAQQQIEDAYPTGVVDQVYLGRPKK